MAFFGFFCALTVRQTLSVAIVAMVNHQTTVSDVDVSMTINFSDHHHEECPRDRELAREDGEFDWDRNQQAVVLAAYFYGRAVTKVS